MRSFAFALITVIGLFAAFVAGISTQSPGLMMAWLCLSPFSYVALGYTLRGLLRGRRLMVVEAQEYSSRNRQIAGKVSS